MKCLVTGAAGFIGSSLVRRLVSEGHDVRGVIHHTQPTYFNNRVEYISGDITNPEFLKPVMDQVDVVFHCAAFVKDYGPKSVFNQINVEGTKNLIAASEASSVKKFIFLSHIKYESGKNIGYYHETKAIAEQSLMEKYTHDHFPVVIIRPGNVYGPGATTWVLRPLQAIQKNRITLIDKGTGIFLHTYIENLLDALVVALQEPRAVGQIIDITDGDNTTTWGDYLNALAKMTGKPPIKKNMSKRTALVVSKLMMVGYTLFKIEPWVTPIAVEIFTNQNTVSIEKAKALLGYEPMVDFTEGLKHVERWLKAEEYIT
ncbi:MAG: NAD(P)-dependent oxidoreductase [Thermoplasmata archaeon]|nr:NAD(P)-dependent oxidoreductase [Thermoplasmata archaeon]